MGYIKRHLSGEKMRQSLKKCILYLSEPVIHNFSFFIGLFILMTLPLWIGEFTPWLHLESVSLSYPKFPDFIFLPIVCSYLLCLLFDFFSKYEKMQFILKCCCGFILIILNIVEFYLLYHFGMGINPFAIQLLLETNNNEASEFISVYIITFSGLLICLSMIGIYILLIYFDRWYTKIIKGKNTFNFYIALFIVAFIVYIGFRSRDSTHKLEQLFSTDDSYKVNRLIKGFPVDLVAKTVFSLKSVEVSKHDGEKLAATIQKVQVDSCSYLSSKIIFILGESFNKHHSNLYGYPYLTNPKLEERKKKGELYVFTDVVTPFNTTSAAMQYMLSTASAEPDADWKNEPLFPMFFRKAGYKVFWLDNQLINNKGSAFDFMCSYYLNQKEIEEASFDVRNTQLYLYDMDLLSAWKDVAHLQSGKDLIVFHLWGQHIYAGERYPQTVENLYFTSDSVQRPDLDKQQKVEIADYDNATRYNDSVVDSIFTVFQDQDAIAIYLSDHGDEVNDYRAHIGRSHERPVTGGQARTQFEVPMFIWCSPRYAENHPEVIRRIKNATGRPFMTDDMPHVLFDLAGIETSCFHACKSVVNDQYKPRPKRFLNLSKQAYEDIIFH